MTKLQLTIETTKFYELLNKVQYVELLSNAFAFVYEDKDYCIDFSKDENGNNRIDEFLLKINNEWESIELYGYQRQSIVDKLENQHKENLLNENPKHIEVDEIFDYYFENGVSRSDFFYP